MKVHYFEHFSFVVTGGIRQSVGTIYPDGLGEDKPSLSCLVSLETEQVHTVCPKWTATQLAQHVLASFSLVGVPRMSSVHSGSLVEYDPKDVTKLV